MLAYAKSSKVQADSSQLLAKNSKRLAERLAASGEWQTKNDKGLAEKQAKSGKRLSKKPTKCGKIANRQTN